MIFALKTLRESPYLIAGFHFKKKPLLASKQMYASRRKRSSGLKMLRRLG